MEYSLAATLWRLAALLALVFANGFFVAAEFSIVAVRKTRIDQLIAEGHRGARAVRRAVTEPDSYIAATQLGITMASLGLGWIGEPAFAHSFEPMFERLPGPWSAAVPHIASVAVALKVVVESSATATVRPGLKNAAAVPVAAAAPEQSLVE